jgi:hypothetical protein
VAGAATVSPLGKKLPPVSDPSAKGMCVWCRRLLCGMGAWSISQFLGTLVAMRRRMWHNSPCRSNVFPTICWRFTRPMNGPRSSLPEMFVRYGWNQS